MPDSNEIVNPSTALSGDRNDLAERGLGGGFTGGLSNLVGDKYQPSGIWKRAFGKRKGPSNMASNLRAKIAREQWEDYKARFQPLENKLIGYARNPEAFATANREQAVGRVNQAFGLLPAQAERRLGSYGLTMTPEQQTDFKRKAGLQQSLGQVQASNLSDRLSEDQIRGIVSGSTLVNSRGLINQKAIGPSQVGG